MVAGSFVGWAGKAMGSGRAGPALRGNQQFKCMPKVKRCLTIFHERNIWAMPWEVEFTNEFGAWWAELDEVRQDRVAAAVDLLAVHGPSLQFPHSSGINGSRHAHMRELRVQS